MTNPGLGVMFHILSGGSKQDSAKYYGRKITAASITNDRLNLEFADGAAIQLWDDGQSCCERRYMTTDDDVSSLVGHELRRIEAKDGPKSKDDWDEVHETCFVEVGTEDWFITLVNHNEHNGYYGDFALNITECKEASEQR